MDIRENYVIENHKNENLAQPPNNTVSSTVHYTQRKDFKPSGANRQPQDPQDLRMSDTRKMVFRMCEIGSTAGERVRRFVIRTAMRSFYITVSFIGGVVGLIFSFFMGLFVKNDSTSD